MQKSTHIVEISAKVTAGLLFMFSLYDILLFLQLYCDFDSSWN